jgi:hypothetical protein
MTSLDPPHLFGISMVVRERFVHLTNTKSIAIGDTIRPIASLFNESVKLSNRYSILRNMRLVVNGRLVCGDDSVLRHCHGR